MKSRVLFFVPLVLLLCAGCASTPKTSSLGGQSDVPDLTRVQGQKIVYQAAEPPFGRIVSNKPGYLESPYEPYLFIDVRGLSTGTLVIDPLCKKGFVVPEMVYLPPIYTPPSADGKTILNRGQRK